MRNKNITYLYMGLRSKSIPPAEYVQGRCIPPTTTFNHPSQVCLRINQLMIVEVVNTVVVNWRSKCRDDGCHHNHHHDWHHHLVADESMTSSVVQADVRVSLLIGNNKKIHQSEHQRKLQKRQNNHCTGYCIVDITATKFLMRSSMLLQMSHNKIANVQ
jgi:hypothetical protein